MEKIKFEFEGYAVEQRRGEELSCGDCFTASEDLCYVLLPVEYAGKNVMVILTEDSEESRYEEKRH